MHYYLSTLLPMKHKFTCLLIELSNKSVEHSGIRDTFTTLREWYWVLRGREAVKKFTRSCVICRKHEEIPYSPLPPIDLPDYRVSPRICHLHILASTLPDRCTLKLRIQKAKSRNRKRAMFAASLAHPPELYIWNLHKQRSRLTFPKSRLLATFKNIVP